MLSSIRCPSYPPPHFPDPSPPVLKAASRLSRCGRALLMGPVTRGWKELPLFVSGNKGVITPPFRNSKFISPSFSLKLWDIFQITAVISEEAFLNNAMVAQIHVPVGVWRSDLSLYEQKKVIKPRGCICKGWNNCYETLVQFFNRLFIIRSLKLPKLCCC